LTATLQKTAKEKNSFVSLILRRREKMKLFLRRKFSKEEEKSRFLIQFHCLLFLIAAAFFPSANIEAWSQVTTPRVA
jgi:hypothetical protein